ncbi:alginate lyase family protein [Paraflavitalea sp. CAU 1676]|uniref:alginate lyase family protein n=1 Tax=Paraflavitalea sp. CAU 1676 TaxID=3032598 RepID=UPI0023DB47B5|nr:alginate lyase family protein [Paraflavitalea sp. CAU 1676]MDF2192932.1 alginate lyase family protein [Paraflavitalea sp. CAU 1676]
MIAILLAGLSMATLAGAQQHPSIMLTKSNVEAVKKGITQYPLLQKSFKSLKKDADKALMTPIEVPQPKDGGGGASHEKHKRNYQDMLACGMLYQLTREERYAKFVQDMLLQYAAVYNSWPRHPKKKQNPGGKMFWQNLNDCVWQVYTIQAYDCVYDYLGAANRKKIETDLFEPIVKELSEVNGEIFNKIHNHGTWSVAAVGMTGYVCGRKDWVDKALRGTALDGKAGFLAQLDQLFSPDGYYTEGPYYQRYAILPFLLFARTIQQYHPAQKIYEYREGLLKKAVNTALQCTYTNKVFFPLNDAMKDKTYESEEIVYAVDIAFSDMGAGNDLLDVAEQQQRVLVSDAGLAVAKAIADGKAAPFQYKPVWIRDGADGKQGGIGILRSGNNGGQACAVFKAASQGMGHGHFDRLNLLFYDNNSEVFSDYGAVRFLNVETKNGGNYTKENETWGKQTLAHNTLVVDRQSQYLGNEKKGEEHAPQLLHFSTGANYQVVSAQENNAYSGIQLRRTLILFMPEGAAAPLLVDVFNAASQEKHQYDLPFWYQGHITNSPFEVQANTSSLSALGDGFGYQHAWLNATGKVKEGSGVITILNNKRFYTTTFIADTAMRIQFITSGAGDPEFNIRNEKAFVLSQPAAGNYSFVSVTEPHGKNNPVAEVTTGATPQVKGLKLLRDEAAATQLQIEHKKKVYTITLDYNNQSSFITIK